MAAASARVVLVTGFEPFGDESLNPSWEIVAGLPGKISGARVEKLRVPTEFGRAIDTVRAAIDRLRPEVVICLGLAGGRAHLSVERIAVNLDDARIPDNAGHQPLDQPVRAQGPAAYFCTVPVKAMAAAMEKAGVPAEVSNSAGTFVCNHLIYGVLDHAALTGLAVRAGFIHVPYLDSQVRDRPDVVSLPLADMIRGVKAAIMAALKHQTDLRLAGGALH